jgi:hypothetical protein
MSISKMATEFLVDVPHAEALDQTLRLLPGVDARIVRVDSSGAPLEVEGHYVVRVVGDEDFFRWAMHKQGYCKVVGPRA